MLKSLFYATALLSTTSLPLFAMDWEEGFNSQHVQKLIAESPQSVVRLYREKLKSPTRENDNLSILFKNALHRLDRKELQDKIEIDSSMHMPDIILNPLEYITETRSYMDLAASHLSISTYNADGTLRSTCNLPDTVFTQTTYLEGGEGSIAITFSGTAYPGGKIINQKFYPEGTPTEISASLSGPLPDYKNESLYVLLSRDGFRSTGKQ